ncbi:putative tartrate transporter, partial [Zancudomyces culisetae]
TSTDQGNINSLFFTTYIAMEPFANIILKKTRPSFWFPFIGISWSITCMCMAAVTNATQAVIIRLLLGIFEAGFTPGMITYLAYWYTREDLGSRMSIMFSAHPGSGIVNLLYGAFASIKIGKLIAYQSIFIFGGTITLVISIAAIFLIKDYPEHAKFFSEKEKALVVKRINASQGSAERSHVTFKSILETILDWKVWAFAILNLSRTASLLILGLIGPTIIKSFGFSRSEATFLFAVVSAIGTCSTIAFAFVFQKVPYWIRIVGADIITAAFFAVVTFSTNNVMRLVFMFGLGIPVCAIFPIATSWMSVNAGSTQKRALMSAVFAMVGNVVGLAVPYLFTTATAPNSTNTCVCTQQGKQTAGGALPRCILSDP